MKNRDDGPDEGTTGGDPQANGNVSKRIVEIPLGKFPASAGGAYSQFIYDGNGQWTETREYRYGGSEFEADSAASCGLDGPVNSKDVLLSQRTATPKASCEGDANGDLAECSQSVEGKTNDGGATDAPLGLPGSKEADEGCIGYASYAYDREGELQETRHYAYKGSDIEADWAAHRGCDGPLTSNDVLLSHVTGPRKRKQQGGGETSKDTKAPDGRSVRPPDSNPHK